MTKWFSKYLKMPQIHITEYRHSRYNRNNPDTSSDIQTRYRYWSFWNDPNIYVRTLFQQQKSVRPSKMTSFLRNPRQWQVLWPCPLILVKFLGTQITGRNEIQWMHCFPEINQDGSFIEIWIQSISFYWENWGLLSVLIGFKTRCNER